MSDQTPPLFPPTFGENFLSDHAGTIVSDPKVALVELVANAHDAGATNVEVTWPTTLGEKLVVTDNGTGMTREELLSRWNCLSYNRLKSQSEFAEFPSAVKRAPKRRVFGQNGKGRFAPFCFASEYEVATTRDGRTTVAEVRQTNNMARPFTVNVTAEHEATGNGTTISCAVDVIRLKPEVVSELLGQTFLSDPQFALVVNGTPVELSDLKSVETDEVVVPNIGTARVHRIDARDGVRHARGGVSWRVHKRLVGDPGWADALSQGHFVEGLPDEAKRLVFVVEADFLARDTKPDWRGFVANETTQTVQRKVYDQIAVRVRELSRATVSRRKRAALRDVASDLRELPPGIGDVVGQFVEQLSTQCPRLSQREVNTAAKILMQLERSRSAYDLLDQLAACTPDQLDQWNTIMKTWSAEHAQLVLTELERRLGQIKKIEELMSNKQSDEVHDLLPVFVNGLWMFGPEFESVEFRANQTLATVLRGLLGGTRSAPPPNRPDIVAVPQAVAHASGSLVPFAINGHDKEGEASGIAKLLIVELKKGGFKIGSTEMQQAKGYANHLKRGGHVGPKTAITAYVLGWELDDVEDEEVGNSEPKTRILPRTYGEIVRRAHARTFNLAAKIRETEPLPKPDADVREEVYSQSACA